MLLQFKRLAHFLNLILGAVMAVYWLITSALLANLYSRFCDEREEVEREDCNENDQRFILLPVFGFICMCAWVS